MYVYCFIGWVYIFSLVVSIDWIYMSDKKYLIYMHTNKINGKKYIGQTSLAPEIRWKNGLGYASSTYFYNSIKKYGWDNFEHEIIARNLSIDEANEMEMKLIEEYKTTDNNFGYNIMPGGRNSPMPEETKAKISKSKMGHEVSDETRKKISANHADMSGKNNPRYGVRLSEETRAKISANNKSWMMKGIKRSEETKRKMRENHADFSGANHPQARAVVQLDLDGNYIATFPTAKEAAKSICQRGPNITICCQNHHRTAGGYMWRYEDEYIKTAC